MFWLLDLAIVRLDTNVEENYINNVIQVITNKTVHHMVIQNSTKQPLVLGSH